MREENKNFSFTRRNKTPFKILARGDCTSRRSTHLNSHLFPNGLNFIQNQKSPFIFFIEASEGKSCTEKDLRELSDVEAMPGSLPNHYLGQADRSILDETDADLIIIDTWADMNFDLWRSNTHGWLCWIHPKYLRDPEWFYANFTKLGKRTFDQSIDDAKKLAEILRRKNSQVPILVLNQQIDYYPKMDSRREYYEFGSELEKIVNQTYFGGVISKSDLELADVGSCGPGLTLHFQGPTYLKMFENALNNGLSEHFPQEPKGKIEFASDNAEKIDYPECEVSFGFNADHQLTVCGAETDVHRNLSPYIYVPNVTEKLRWTPAVIEVPKDGDYSSWEHAVKKRYDRVRMKRRSERNGYQIEPFHWKQFIPDVHEIHHSAEARSGGAMRGSYLQTLEEMGGAPDRVWEPVQPKCNLHWGYSMGVFKPLEGHSQGEVTVNKKLVGYINLKRSGDIVLYSRIMGHADNLSDGIMYHLHFSIVEWVFENRDPMLKDLKFIMYGGVGNGGQNLWQWKRTAGFVPTKLFVA